MTEENSDIVVYRGSPLERITLDKAMQKFNPNTRSVHLASDIFSSDFGVTGFLLVDYTPEKARGYYPNGDYGWTTPESEWEEGVKHGYREPNLRIKCKHVAIPSTLKLVRYFIMPEEVGDLFRSDNFLGEPMINKICREDIVPENFEEEHFPISFDNEKQKEFAAVLEEICGVNIFDNLGVGYLADKNHRAYQSFHLYMDFMQVKDIGQESVVKALARFDQFITKFDSKGQLNDQRKNLIAEEGKQYPTLLLPED